MAALAADSAASLGTLAELQELLSTSLQSLDAGLGAASAAYLRLFEAAGQLSQQPNAAVMILMQFYARAGACEGCLGGRGLPGRLGRGSVRRQRGRRCTAAAAPHSRRRCAPLTQLPSTTPAAAGAAVTPLQKARMTAACRPLHPDVPAVVHAGLEHLGLLPPDLATPPPHPTP